jgi:hypothetical protein
MTKPNQYKWLIVAEGDTDVATYGNLLTSYGVSRSEFSLFPAHGKGYVCNAATWGNISHFASADLLSIVKTDIGRTDFRGIILLVDSDSDSEHSFVGYRRNEELNYEESEIPAISKRSADYWVIDVLNGTNRIPVLGINVPSGKSGCLETDLLDAYGFPVERQAEYASFEDIIQKSSDKWNVPLLSGGGNWWDNNRRAKLDKFIYSALSHGFAVSRQKPRLPNVPSVITSIKAAVSDSAYFDKQSADAPV